jgi:mevalonate kinase
MTTGRAPGKVILLGEHAVVYGQPAIAVPIEQVVARATVIDLPVAGSRPIVEIRAPDIGISAPLDQLPLQDPLRRAVELCLEALGETPASSLQITINSSIPVAAGMGSGAAVTIALIRALSRHLGAPLSPARQSELAFEIEKLHHGTPSGIDNSVIAFDRPVWYERALGPQPFAIAHPFILVIADSGHAAPTAAAVAYVRQLLEADRAKIQPLIEAIGQLVRQARSAIDKGNLAALGRLMNQNHELLNRLGLSTPSLDQLIMAARQAGAAGAKLSGAGMGGNVIALVTADGYQPIQRALEAAGAVQVWICEVGR